MTRGEFILEIKNEIRGSCALPYSIPDKEIGRIVDQAKKWFYVNYGEAVETKYYVITRDKFSLREFKAGRQIQMPKCVVSVSECREMSGGGSVVFNDADFSNDRFIAAELYISPFQTDDLVMVTAQKSYWDLAQAFILDRIAYDYNRNTSKLKIRGRDPVRDVLLTTYIEIPEESLFEDWYFIRWCTAQTKLALGRILGFFEYQLPGGVTVNSQDIRSEGQEEVDKIKQEILDEQSPDFFFTFH